MRNVQKGFSLIELVMAVAIVAIISAIAVPAYQNNVEKSRRTDAQGALMGLSNAMERYYAQNNTYAGAALGSGGIFPDQAPVDGSTKFYDLAIASATASAYSVTATPRGAQAGNGRLSLDSTGTRAWTANDDGTGTSKNW